MRAPPHGFSQLAASFLACPHLGIPRVPLLRLTSSLFPQEPATPRYTPKCARFSIPLTQIVNQPADAETPFHFAQQPRDSPPRSSTPESVPHPFRPQRFSFGPSFETYSILSSCQSVAGGSGCARAVPSRVERRQARVERLTCCCSCVCLVRLPLPLHLCLPSDRFRAGRAERQQVQG